MNKNINENSGVMNENRGAFPDTMCASEMETNQP